jgi:hypothetical protein
MIPHSAIRIPQLNDPRPQKIVQMDDPNGHFIARLIEDEKGGNGIFLHPLDGLGSQGIFFNPLRVPRHHVRGLAIKEVIKFL